MSNNILNEKKKIRRWWDDDGDDIGYEEGEVTGKFEKKKKSVKEGFSNWRQDLSEVMNTIEKEENDKEITEKKVIKNKIKINPNLGEAVEELGGTLLEMVEIEDFEEVFDDLSESDIFFLTDDLIEEVVEEVFEECIQEGYNVFEIENTLLESLEVSSALLNEAKVTYGHDTDVKSDRLEKVKSAVKNVGKGILRGVGYVAGTAVRGTKAAGREFSKGYERGRYGSSSSDSSSDTSSSSSSSGSSRPGLLGRIGSALKKGLKKVVAKGARAVSRGARSVARRMSDGESQSSSPSSTPKAKVTQGKGRERSTDQKEPIKPARPARKTKVTAAKPKGKPNPQNPAKPKGKPNPQNPAKPAAKPKGKPNPQNPAKPAAEPNPKNPGQPSLNNVLRSIHRSEEFQLSEMSVSKDQQKLFGLALSVKREKTPRSGVSAEVLKIVDGMSEKEIRKFAKTSHEGLPKKVKTKEEAIRESLLDRMLEKIKQQLQEKPGD